MAAAKERRRRVLARRLPEAAAAAAAPSEFAPQCAASASDVTLDDATVLINNLGGMGPDRDAPPVLRLSGLSTGGGYSFDLVVSNVTRYAPHDATRNGMLRRGASGNGGNGAGGGFGRIHIGSGRTRFRFALVGSGHNDPIPFAALSSSRKLFWSIFHFDADAEPGSAPGGAAGGVVAQDSGACRRVSRVNRAEHDAFFAPGLAVSRDAAGTSFGSVGDAAGATATAISAKAAPSGALSPLRLRPEQIMEAVGVALSATAFELELGVEGGEPSTKGACAGGRSFLFAAHSAAIPCGESDAFMKAWQRSKVNLWEEEEVKGKGTRDEDLRSSLFGSPLRSESSRPRRPNGQAVLAER